MERQKELQRLAKKRQLLRLKLREEREQISLFSRPAYTLLLFSQVSSRWAVSFVKSVLAHPVFRYVVVPLAIAFAALDRLEGDHTPALEVTKEFVAMAVWWLSLGILSSVGFGSGLHTGVLYLFPHIGKICATAMDCESVQFDTYGAAAWECQAEGEGFPAFFDLWKKAFLPCFFWGAGTAIGEVPPYLISRSAALAGKIDEEFEEAANTPSRFAVVDKMKMWMFDVLKRHGFWTILLFAAWPNAFFDLCGLACGHFLIPFWVFFGATFIGKAIIKVNSQSALFVVLFTSLESVATRAYNAADALGIAARLNLSLDSITTKLNALVTKMHKKEVSNERFWGVLLESPSKFFALAKENIQNATLEQSWQFVWQITIFTLIGYFVVTMVDALAQKRQAELDEQRLSNKSGKKAL